MPNSQPLDCPFYQQKIGVVGGGQLGKMLAMAAAPLSLSITVLDKEPESSARGYTHAHVTGDPLNEQDILRMAENMDVITIEMENVNVEALKKLKSMGKIVCPPPECLEIIQDKGLQKKFYQKKNLKTSIFEVFNNLSELKAFHSSTPWDYPFVVKCCRAGYDGKGVFMINEQKDIDGLPEDSYVMEKKVDLKKELSVIVARNGKGESIAYPINELHTHHEANLLSHMTCPADISKDLAEQSKAFALQVVDAFELQGILAVELFLDQNDELWINEVSPRPHNTGHHTIEAFVTSQYEQHLRAILDLPLGTTKMLKPSALLNVLGPVGQEGVPVYEGLEKLLAMDGVKPHLYGKPLTKPHRKLGHITILADELSQLEEKVNTVQATLKVRT
jgi:5-(carboxyamino)imidazole ribonucleotide synthase